MKLERATVVSQEELYANTHLMWLSCPAVAKGASPGRFLMLHCSDSLDPLLPRPMSFHRFRDVGGERQFAILYDVRGRGTTWLSKRTAGHEIDVFGPLGRGYEVDKSTQHLLLVVGGLGIAAVVSLADEAVESGRSVTLLQGARSAEYLFPPAMLPREVEAIDATDDGSAGHKGVVTDLLGERLPWADQVFACGPTPMFAAMTNVVREMRSRKPIQALLEERMGCGTGVCYGCAVFTPKGVRLVCKDGPRFELTEAFR
jgi:dihydroorotate dehydrogenase electron transfer subunit